MKKPSRYFVPFEDADLVAQWKRDYPDDAESPDPTAVWREKNFDDLEAAKRFARTPGELGEVYERVGMTDVTPSGDPRGLLWEWDEKVMWTTAADVACVYCGKYASGRKAHPACEADALSAADPEVQAEHARAAR